MKKCLSVFTLTARESIWHLSVLWMLSSVLQAVFFYNEMNSSHVRETMLLSEAFRPYDDRITVPLIFAVTLLLSGIILIKTGMEFRTKTSYTLRRLRITEKQIFIIQSAYNCIMILVLFLFETALCFLLVNQGTRLIAPQYITNQTTYLTFYSAGFLHTVFAGRNILTAARNILIILSFGFNTAAFTYLWRRGSKHIFGILFIVACSFLYWWSPADYGHEVDIGFIITALGMLLTAIGVVHSRREEYDT